MMYHVLVLVFALTGQPAGVVRASGANDFTTLEACTAALEARMVDTQAEIDKTDGLAGKYAVVRGNCFSDDQIDKMKGAKPKPEERGA